MKKKIMTVVGCLALCGMAVAGTYAWLQSTTNTLTNVFTSSNNVSADLTEDKFDAEKAKNYLPNDQLDKNPTITNTSNIDVYGAIKVEYQKVTNGTAANINVTEFNKMASIDAITNGWTLAKTLADGSEVYVYATPLIQNASATLFNKVLVSNDIELVNGVLPSFNVKVTGYVTQATGTNLTDATNELIGLASNN